MSTKLINLSIKHIAGVDKPANKRKFLIVKTEKPEPTPPPANDDQKNKGASMLTKEQIAKIADKEVMEAVVTQMEEMAALDKKVKEQAEEIEKIKANPPAPISPEDLKKEEIWKGVPPALRNRVEALQKERDDFAKAAKDERDERENMSWINKVRGFDYLQVMPENLGKVMKSIAESSPDNADLIYDTLEKANKLISKGALFSEIGKVKNGSKVYDATNVTARIEAMADDKMAMAKANGKPIDRAQAYDEIFKGNPDLHKAYRNENSSHKTDV